MGLNEEMRGKMIGSKGWLYLFFLLGSLLFIGVTHRGTILGDYIFQSVGIPAWSDPATKEGVHYSAIFGIVLIVLSGKMAIQYFRQRNIKFVGRTVILSCIIFLNSYPLLTEQLYYAIHRNGTGIAVVDLLKKESRCEYRTHENTVPVQCTLRLVNYGGDTETVMIRPLLHDRYVDGMWSFVEVPHEEISLPPRSNKLYTVRFESMPDDRIQALQSSGSTVSFGVEFVKDGQKKAVYTH